MQHMFRCIVNNTDFVVTTVPVKVWHILGRKGTVSS